MCYVCLLCGFHYDEIIYLRIAPEGQSIFRVLFFTGGKSKMKTQTQKITLIAMFCALAYAAVAIGRVPVVLFLKYDPKDIVITLSGLIISPAAAMIVSVVSSVIEMVSVSDTGIIGCIMNIVSSCSFACTTAFVYKKKRTLFGAGLGLIIGCLTMISIMLLWNYCITPIYMGYPREAVVKLLLPAFLPFNLIKGSLNAALTFLLYKPVVTSLRNARLLPNVDTPKKKTNIPLLCVAIIVIVTCILLILAMNKII